MPEHVHLLIWPTQEQYSMSDILLSIKQSVARRAVSYLKRYNPAGLSLLATRQKHTPYRFWQDGGGYDRNIRESRTLQRVVRYIHENPVRRGLAGLCQEWEWSSFRQWEDLGTGPIPIDKESFLTSVS